MDEIKITHNLPAQIEIKQQGGCPVDDKYWHYEQCDDSSTKPCPKCNKKMIVLWQGQMMCSNPPQQRWYWWCGCGHSECGGVHVYRDTSPSIKERWEAANASG